MSSSCTRTEKLPKEAYNEVPVHYCKSCLSLKIMRVANLDDTVYCEECGSTDVEETTIEGWEDLFKKRYGFKYLKNSF